MPLPKSASIAARATDVYSEVCPLVMRALNGGPFHTDLHQLLPYLRQLLTCCACAGVLTDPLMAVPCGHCYCYQCQFGEPLLKIHCRQCRQRQGLVTNTQLKIIAKLYRELTHILSAIRPITDQYLQEIINEVREGVKVSRGLFYIQPPERYRHYKLTAINKPKPTPVKRREEEREDREDIIPAVAPLLVDDYGSTVCDDCFIESDISSNMFNHFTLMKGRPSYNKLQWTVKKRGRRRRHVLTPSLRQSVIKKMPSQQAVTVKMETSNVSFPLSLISKPPSVIKKKKKKKINPSKSAAFICSLTREQIDECKRKYSCRCGTNPGVMYGHLICMKKKCPCFYNGLPCIKCRCRGCCNPYRLLNTDNS